MPARKPPAKPKAASAAKPAPAARKPGRPAYEANDKDRTMVRLLCAGGITQDRIAVAICIRANAAQATTSAIFWLSRPRSTPGRSMR